MSPDRPAGLTLDDVREAERRIAEYVTKTPVMTSRRLDAMAGRSLLFKCELFQRTGSFKFRGAVNFVSKLLEETEGGARRPCLATYSCGNFGQGLALAASLFGVEAYVVLPDDVAACRLQAVKGYGAQVTLSPPDEKELMATTKVIAAQTGAVYAPTSNHLDIMAGQGTICTELLEQVGKNLDAIVVCVGGGGMLSGILVAAKALRPGIRVFAAEPELADDCFRSFVAKEHVRQESRPVTVADGSRIALGDVAWPIVRDLVDDVITVTEDEIKASTRLVWQYMKLCIEPCAGVAVAAAMSEKFRALCPDSKSVGVILSGGNVDLDSVEDWL